MEEKITILTKAHDDITEQLIKLEQLIADKEVINASEIKHIIDQMSRILSISTTELSEL